MEKLYNKIQEMISLHIEDYKYMVKSMYENPEIGFEEFKTQKLLTDYLIQAGFDTQLGVVCKTDFIGEYKSKKDGPTIGFLCEYDALPEVGHGCGHNMIGVMSIGAAQGLKNIIDEIGGTIKVIGTPAEENFGGKVFMGDAGVFNDLDVALMIHPGDKNSLGGRSNALNPIRFEFFGKNAHACHPYEGKSALDAAVMTYVQINMLRQFVKPQTFIHGVIKNGGTAANVIPAYASMDYYFRAPKMAYAKEVSEKAIKIAEGCCLAHGCELKTTIFESPYTDTLVNYKLAELLKEKYEYVGLTDIEPVNEVGGGSTDVGTVSYICPTVQGGIKICDNDVLGHSKEMADATISSLGSVALYKGALSLAYLACDLITNKELLKEIKDEFEQSRM